MSLKFLTALLIVFSVAGVDLAYAVVSQPTKTEVTQNAAAKSPVNINTANLDALKSLKGIGPKKAQAIIDYRNQHGDFKSLHDLTAVKGISEKFLAKLQKNNPDMILVKPN